MLSVVIFYCYAECRYAECRYAECRYAECRQAECHYAECLETIIKIFVLAWRHNIEENDTYVMKCHASFMFCICLSLYTGMLSVILLTVILLFVTVNYFHCSLMFEAKV